VNRKFLKFFPDLPEFLKKNSGNFLRPSNFGMKKSRLFHQTCLKGSAFHSRFFEKFSGFQNFFCVVKNPKKFFVEIFSGRGDETMKTLDWALFLKICRNWGFRFLQCCDRCLWLPNFS
jgi:hypothetical protein